MKNNNILNLKGLFFIFMILGIVFTAKSYAYEKEMDLLSKLVAEQIQQNNKKKIGVIDFTNLEGKVTALGRFIAEEFSVILSDKAGKKFSIVDRTLLNNFLKNNKSTTTLLLEPKTVKKLGSLLGIDVLIMGNLMLFKENIRISLKLLDTQTTEVIYANTSNMIRTTIIEEILSHTEVKVNNSKMTAIKNAWSKIEQKEFVIELKGCHLSENTVTCSFDMTNQGLERMLALNSGSTRLVDDIGNEYEAATFQFSQAGNRRMLTPNITKTARVIFKKVSQQTQGITSLQIQTHIGLFEWHNIPLVH